MTPEIALAEDSVSSSVSKELLSLISNLINGVSAV